MTTHRTATAVLALALLTVAPAIAGTSFTFPMTGRQEVPAAASSAFGQCTGILSEDESTFELHCTHNVAGAFAAHIHRGTPDVAGPVIFPLGDGTSPIQATWNPTAAEVADLLLGNLYVNVHTPAFPGGEVRGQIRVDTRLGDRSLAFPLEEGQEVPPTGVDASGSCLVTIDSADQLSLTCVHDLGATVGAHIHLGAPGVNGGVVFPLGTGASPIRATIDLSQDELATLLAGDYYVNVHTAEFPDGALRGQIAGCIQDQHTLCLNRGRFAVTADWVAPPDHPVFTSGSGFAVPLTDDTGAFWFFNPDNLELNVKVLNACLFVGHYWVFAAGLTNVEVTLTVTDTAHDETRTYENPQGQAFQPIQDSNAFATCP